MPPHLSDEWSMDFTMTVLTDLMDAWMPAMTVLDDEMPIMALDDLMIGWEQEQQNALRRSDFQSFPHPGVPGLVPRGSWVWVGPFVVRHQPA